MKRKNSIRCININTGRIVYAYHVEDCGAAHNKLNTLCIGCLGVDLLPSPLKSSQVAKA